MIRCRQADVDIYNPKPGLYFLDMATPQPFNLTVSPEEQEMALSIQKDVDRGLVFLEKQQSDPAISAFKQAAEKAAPGSPVRDIITHNLLTAYRQRINQLLDAGEPLHVNRYLPEVSPLSLQSPLADDPEFRGKFADALRNLSLDFYNARQHEVALFFIRKAISVEPCPSYYIELTNALAWLKTPARLADYVTRYPANELGRHIFVTCAPKSGSTFLKNVLAEVTGFKTMFPVYAALQNEQELDLPNFVKFGNVNTVTQQHARASEANIQMMQAFGVRPIILVRNIFDTTVSLLDFYTKGYTFSTFFNKEDFLAFDDDTKIDLLIEYVLPWYFQFVASWQLAEREKRIEVKWITYEDMIADKPSMIENVLAFNGINTERERIIQVIGSVESDGEKNRFNKGISGRGKAVLTSDQRERITKLARYFPSAEFSLLGI